MQFVLNFIRVCKSKSWKWVAFGYILRQKIIIIFIYNMGRSEYMIISCTLLIYFFKVV
jgi:hypothetical protein